MFVDSHAHLTSDPLFPDIDPLLIRAKEAGVTHIVNICTDRKTTQRGIELHQRYPWVVNAGSTTPHDAETLGEEDFDFFKASAEKGDLIAIGETGLDYYYYQSTQEIQKKLLIRYADLAQKYGLPLIIHCREAFKDLFEILEKQTQVLLHCFTGTLEDAKEIVSRGWLLSLSGIVTYKKSLELKEVAAWVPLENLTIETDAPYLSPNSKRGKTNEPSYLPETAKVIAELKGISLETLAFTTTTNTLNFFRLQK